MPATWRAQSVSLQALLIEACWRPMVGDLAGDFHDLIDLRDGRIAVVIGDVAGYGPVAAAQAEELRGALGSAFRKTDHPPEVLAELDAAVDAGNGDLFVTMACAVIDPVAKQVEVANAGHPPIVFVDRMGSHLLDEVVQPPIGLWVDRESARCELPADAALFFYTDGLIERRGERLDVALEALVDAARGLFGPVASAAELARRATGRLGQPSDDATVISVRLLPQGVRRNGGEATSLSLARERVLLRVYIDPRELRSVRTESVAHELALRAPSELEVVIEVIDITRAGVDVESDGVLASPTIVRVVPEPRIRVVGSARTARALADALRLPLDEENR